MKRLKAQVKAKETGIQKKAEARAQGTGRLTVIEAYEAQIERSRMKSVQATIRKSLISPIVKEKVLTAAQQQEKLLKKVAKVFEGNQLHNQIYNARAGDIGEPISVDGARLFKEEMLKRNKVKNSNQLNLQSLRLGLQSIYALS